MKKWTSNFLPSKQRIHISNSLSFQQITAHLNEDISDLQIRTQQTISTLEWQFHGGSGSGSGSGSETLPCSENFLEDISNEIPISALKKQIKVITDIKDLAKLDQIPHTAALELGKLV